MPPAVESGPDQVLTVLVSDTGLDISAALLARARAYEEAEPLGIRYLQADVTASGVLEVWDSI